jgi:alanine-synthesizing transaminase
MFVWAKIPPRWTQQMDSVQFAMKLLEEGDVVVSPGGGFGAAGEGFLRMSLVENENRLRQAVRQIGRCLGAEGQDALPEGTSLRTAGGVQIDGLSVDKIDPRVAQSEPG